MNDMIISMKNDLMGLINPSAFTSDSVEGVIIILLFLFLVYEVSHKAIHFAGWLCGLIFMFQVGHWLSFTGLNRMIPLNTIFKYDVLTAIAQCFVGTKVCDGLLYANAFIRTVCSQMYNLLSGLV